MGAVTITVQIRTNLVLELEITNADDDAPLGQDVHDVLLFDCDEAGTLQFVRLWVTDASGNSDYCVSTVFVEDVNG